MQASAAYSLPKTIVQIREISARGGGKGYALNSIRTPDPVHSYALNYVPSPTSSDTWDIKINKDSGYIEGVNLTLDDQTDDIITTLARSAGRVAGANLLSGDKEPDGVVVREFDISNPASFAAAKDWLSTHADLVMECQGACDVAAPRVGDTTDEILFRHPFPATLTLSSPDGKSRTAFRLQNLNASPILGIPADRAFAVERKLVVKFTDGVVTQVTHTKPSELAAAVGIPGAAVGALLGGLATGFGDQDGAVKAEKTLLESQTGLINAQAKQIEALAALAALQKPQALGDEKKTGEEKPIEKESKDGPRPFD